MIRKIACISILIFLNTGLMADSGPFGITITFFSKKSKVISENEISLLKKTFATAKLRFGHLRNSIDDPYSFEKFGESVGRLNRKADTVDRDYRGHFVILCKYWAEPEWKIESEEDMLKFLREDQKKLKPVIAFLKAELAPAFDIEIYEGSF